MIDPKFHRKEVWGQLLYDPSGDEFEAYIEGEPQQLTCGRPISVGCLVTGRCNLKCGFCYGNREALPSHELTANEWDTCFKQLKSFGAMRVDVSGGEPTIRPDLPQILRSALTAGLNVVLSTNGQLMGDTGVSNLPQGIRIHVSLDSGVARVHESSRLLQSGNPSFHSFQKTSAFISNCVDLGFRTRVMTCVGPHNQDDLLELAEHLALLGVTDWSLSRVLSAGRAGANYGPKWAVADQQILNQIHVIQDNFPWMTIRFSNRTAQDGYFLLLLPDGSLATQFTDARDKLIFGKLAELSLNELVEHPHFSLERHSQKWIARSIHSDHAVFDMACNELAFVA